MNKEILPAVAISILDKEYHVACPEEEREALFNAAHILDERMREIRSTGRVIGLERIAVMAALNFAHELLQNRMEKEEYNRVMNARVKHIQEKIDAVLHEKRSER